MHKNITISEEEYAEVISQLEEINKEKRKILEENKAEILAFYQECRSNGEKLANDWIMNLVLLLTRKNQIIFGKISYECKNYSSQFSSPFVRQTVNQGINSWMNRKRLSGSPGKPLLFHKHSIFQVQRPQKRCLLQLSPLHSTLLKCYQMQMPLQI